MSTKSSDAARDRYCRKTYGMSAKKFLRIVRQPRRKRRIECA